MSVESKKDEINDNAKAHDAGAYTSWGVILGGLAGLVVGLLVGKVIMAVLSLAVVGWVIGALVDRAKR